MIIPLPWPHFYQTRSAWSVDQGSNKNHSPAYNFAPTVTKLCVMWEGLSLPHDTTFGNYRCKIVDNRSFPSWSLIHGLRWSGLIKVGPASLIIYCTCVGYSAFSDLSQISDLSLNDNFIWEELCQTLRDDRNRGLPQYKLISIGIIIIKIKRYHNRLIFIKGIPIPGCQLDGPLSFFGKRQRNKFVK